MKPISSFLLAILLCFFAAEASAARIDMLPRKIVIEDRQRSSDLTLMNLGDKPSVVRMELVSYRQEPDGSYKKLEAPLNAAFDPATVVRFSPRQFTLPPGGRQKVRISIQKPANLPEGEYRFHIKATSFDEGDSIRRQPVKGSSMAIKTNLSVAIPVVVRNGALTSGAKLGNVSFVSAGEPGQKRPGLRLDITRTGAAGVLGTLTAYSEVGGEMKEIGKANNLNVFSEVQTRTFVLPLNEVPQGAIRLRYTDDFGNKGLLDELVLQK